MELEGRGDTPAGEETMNQAIINNTRKNLRFEIVQTTGVEKAEVSGFTIELHPQADHVRWFLKTGTTILGQGQAPGRTEAVTQALEATFN